MQYQDWDGDGYPDHVLGPDGIWVAFDPQTGALLSAPTAAPSSGGNITTGSFPDGFGGSSGGGSGPSYAPPPPPSSFGSSYPTTPKYANGSTHPFFGGEMPRAGGTWNTGQPGFRQQVSVPGGATAGPFAVRSAPSADSGSYGGGGSSGGGGGGDTRGLIAAWRSKILGNLYPGSGRSSYSGSSGYSSSYTPYEPETPKMRGFAKHFAPEQAMGLYSRPSMLIPKVAKGLSPSSPAYADLAALPMTQLVKASMGKKISEPQVDAYGNLTAKDRSLSDFTNSLASMYSKIINNESWFNYDKMAGNMMHPKGALGADFKDLPAATQASNWLGYTSAILNSTLDPKTAVAWQAYANTLADKFGSKHLKKAGSGNIARKMSKKVFYE